MCPLRQRYLEYVELEPFTIQLTEVRDGALRHIYNYASQEKSEDVQKGTMQISETCRLKKSERVSWLAVAMVPVVEETWKNQLNQEVTIKSHWL